MCSSTARGSQQESERGCEATPSLPQPHFHSVNTTVSPDGPPRLSPFPHASHITFLVYFLLAALLHGCVSGYSEEVIAESGGAERSNKDGCERLTPAGSCLAGLQAGQVSLVPPGAPCGMMDGGAGALLELQGA